MSMTAALLVTLLAQPPSVPVPLADNADARAHSGAGKNDDRSDARAAAQSRRADEPPRDARLPRMTVRGRRPAPFERSTVRAERAAISEPDTARVMRSVPGGNIADNGPVSSQVQYRGLFGPRMNVLVDGMYIASGGPNWMDPPLHYVPLPLLDSIEVERGIAPVSSGGETLGGTVLARTKRSRFSDGAAFEVSGDISATGRTIDDGFAGGGIVAAANDTHRLHVLGASEIGDDIAFGDGVIRASEHERHTYGAGYGINLGAHELSLDYRHTDTDDSGNPALPMDIDFLDTDILRAGYRGRVSAMALEGQLYYSDIGHRMNNFKLRPTPDFNPMTPGPDPRLVDARAEGLGYDLTATWTVAQGELTVGVDGHLAEHDMVIRNPDNERFFVTQFNATERDRYGVFAEWTAPLAEATELTLGVRYNRIEMDAGEVDAAPARRLPPPQRLRDAFNAADRSRADDNLDWTVELQHQLSEHLAIEAGAARKTRSPGYLQRYLWLPVEVTAGLGDGNNYVGDPDLDPEVSHQFELGLEWLDERLRVSPRAFYRTVDDFIQGTPATASDVITVSTLNGDPTPMRFSNVEAELFGVDVDAAYQLTERWRVDGTFSYVRGKRRDIDDDLFRIAPPNLRVRLTRETGQWQGTFEAVGYAEQDNISRTIVLDEPSTTNRATSGYAVFHLYGQWRPDDSPFRLTAGIDNLFDRDYTDHLAGFNRVQQSDVPSGARIPGRGRNAFVRVSVDF